MFESTTSQPYKFFLEIIYQRTAAALAAAAIAEAFPGSEFLEGGETARGFFCQFQSSYTLPPEALPLLEERMRLIVRENRPIEELEMVSFCAKELFIKLRRPAAIAALEECHPKDLVSVLQVGQFYELMDGPFCPSIRDVGAFQVVSLKPLGERIYQIEGCAFATKQELKDYVRKLSKYEEGNHSILGQRLGFWIVGEEGFIWKKKGLEVKQLLLSFLKKMFGGEELAPSNPLILKKYALSRIKPMAPLITWILQQKTADFAGKDGFFDDLERTLAEQIIYCVSGELKGLLISLLQTIDKTLIILGFQPHLRLSSRKKGEKSLKLLQSVLGKEVPFEVDGLPGARLQWMVADGLGRSQVALEIELQGEETTFAVKLRIEKILALLLEQKGGNLPNWLIPEQVRIIALAPANRAQANYAEEIKKVIEVAGYRATVDGQVTALKERLSEAMRAGIPVLLLIGDQEMQTNTVTLRERGSERSEPLAISQLKERMNRIFDVEKTKC